MARANEMSRLGLVHVYTGKGKGKTSAAVGAGIRAVGQGLKVHMIQFLKGGKVLPASGELKVLENISGFTVEQFGPDHFVNPDALTKQDLEIIQKGLNRASKILAGGDYDLVILDEMSVVLSFNMAQIEVVLDMLRGRAEGTEVIITGRDAPRRLIEYADLVSNIQEVKHPFNKGIQARRGIEY
jgi:cob(I)alamin adenosyltransferase